MLRLKVLGRLQLLRLDGTAVEMKGLRDRALLMFLALQSGAQPRERVVGLLWEDRPEAQARQSLRQSLSALRRAGLPIIADGKELVAMGAGLDCDAMAFIRAASGQTLAKARSQALAILDKIKAGEDPTPDFKRRQSKAAEGEDQSFQAVAGRFLAQYCRGKKKPLRERGAHVDRPHAR